MTTPGCSVGIDVSKTELVVSTATASIGSFANDAVGHRDLAQRLHQRGIGMAVMESTGPYSQRAALALMAAGLSVAVVCPGRVRSYARSLGLKAKTDAIDARLIARFGDAVQPRPMSLPDTMIARLRALVDRRDQLVDLRRQEENRLESCPDGEIAEELRSSIDRLHRTEQHYSQQIAEQIAAHEPLARLSAALQTEAGVGLLTAASLLAHLPELGQLNRQQVAALAGLAPYNRDSGTQVGKRSIAGGRSRVRRALYIAAVSAVRWNAWIVAFYQRLRQQGKPAKLALIACARKLLVRLNSLAAKALASPEAASVGTPA